MQSSTQLASQSAGADAPIFLVGTTRSGTTLLSLMLGHHPQIAFVGELEWVWDFPDEAHSRNWQTPALPDYYAWVQTQRHYLHHKLRLDRSLPFDDLARSFLAQMREQTDPQQHKPRYGCQVHRHYRQALQTWPNARFIHIVRDGRDVCASWIKFGWLGNAYEAGLRWCEALTEWDTVKPTIPPAQHLELRFEDLITQPEQQMQRLCAFLGVPYDDAVMRYHEDTTYEPIDPRQAGKWRKQLGSRDIRLFEAVASHELQKNGYTLSGEAPYTIKPWSRPALWLEGKVQHHKKRADIFGPKLWLAEIVARRFGPQWLKDRVRLELNEIENAKVK